MTSKPRKPAKSRPTEKSGKMQFFIFPRDATPEEMAEHIQTLRARARGRAGDDSSERKK